MTTRIGDAAAYQKWMARADMSEPATMKPLSQAEKLRRARRRSWYQKNKHRLAAERKARKRED
jgi:hypothetical protein